MTKKANATRVINMITTLGLSYKVLDSNDHYPIHIRIKDVDIWPSTGSYRKGNKTVRRNHDKLITEIELMAGFIRSKSKAPVEIKAKSKLDAATTGRLFRLEVKVDQLLARMDKMEGIL